jgi:hypothetical protein
MSIMRFMLLTTFIASAALIAACDTEELPTRRPTSRASGGQSINTVDAAAGDTTTSWSDGGAPPAIVDAAAAPIDAAPQITAFSDTAPFALITPATQSTDHHGGDSNAGKDCLLCHTGAGAPQFIAAGTVFTTHGSNVGASGVQVRIVSSADEEIAFAGTDGSGNFWVAGTTPLPANAKVGIRDATQTRLMTGTPKGSCNQSNCHVSTTQPIFLSQ